MRVLFMVLVSCFISTLTVSAQDIHFSHIHASPLYLNPSFTGLINDGAARLIVNSKSQWNTVTNAYSTAAASADIKLMANKGTLISGGMQIFADKAGDLALTTVKTALSASIIKSLDFDDNYLLNFGVNAGHVTNRIDYSQRIGFDDEPLIAQGIDSKINYWDFGVGLSWFARLSEHSQVYVGGSFWHFNTPDVSFSQNLSSSSSSTDENDLQREKLYAKKVIHGGGSFKVGKRVWLEPSFIFMDQGPHQEINTGTFVKYLKSKKRHKTYSFYLGAWLRWYLESDINGVDAAVAAVRMDYNNTYFTLSYDVNLSTFQRASNGAGGFELSLIHILAMDRYSRRLSPVCCPKI